MGGPPRWVTHGRRQGAVRRCPACADPGARKAAPTPTESADGAATESSDGERRRRAATESMPTESAPTESAPTESALTESALTESAATESMPTPGHPQSATVERRRAGGE